ncbi:C6 zinc finger domain-containing protein [Colletotrichum truncatum]|uniref:C6 zinc finger domain-containing protein n=1 Tax=Colletotrichum truncatum TaxID=5467 RepID=A0ACC3YRA0_COLTU|nr:C6 zinc finger domain-containing protein [Colletotrichum truncatum]KAF6799081.1 C6 zinc finger domain-containing protein [Colletotrichum truncatum]
MMTDAVSLAIPEDSGYSTTSTPKERNRSSGKRISHRKSRTGCKTCKGRKVKCDELHPSCSRCERLRIRCEYTHLQKSSSPDGYHDAHSPYLKRETTPKRCSSVVAAELDFLQLELLHTYGTFTCATMAWSPALRDFWKITVPSLALKNSYLMRALLAIPALHLAHLRPERRGLYVSAALEYHRVASETTRAMLQSVSGDDAVPLLLFSALNIIIVLAIPQRSSKGVITDEDASFNDLTAILKGMKGILEALWDDLSESALAPLLNYGKERWNLQQNPWQPRFEPQSHADSLHDLYVRISSRVSDADTLAVYARAIEALRDAADWVRFWEGADALVWMYRSLEDFVPLLESRSQEALVVLAHFAVLLNGCEARWWLQGWPVQIMSNVYRQLDDEHRMWIYGPATEIGWIFPTDDE